MPEALALGVPVSLAVDGAASQRGRRHGQRGARRWLMHRADPRAGAARHAAAAAWRDAMTVEDVVHIGTAGGARMLGLDGVGTLEVGQAADIAVYDLDQPRHFGLHDPALGPVVSGGRPTLRALLVHGRVVVENDAIPGLDMAQLRAEAQRLVPWMKQS